MFDTVVQVLATVGPIALAVMGFWVSIKPSSPKSRANWMWAASFVIVGVATGIASFSELRGTDTILGSIWEKVNVENGPRLEFAGVKQDPSTGNIAIQFSNTKDVDAAGYRLGATISLIDEPYQIEEHFSQLRKYIIENTVLERGGTPISRGMGITLPPIKLPMDYDSLTIDAGKRHLYMFVIAAYVAERTPPDRLWVTSVCAKIVKPFTGFEACQRHNGYFYSDKKLTGVL
jgi:hypothetical protein